MSLLMMSFFDAMLALHHCGSFAYASFLALQVSYFTEPIFLSFLFHGIAVQTLLGNEYAASRCLFSASGSESTATRATSHASRATAGCLDPMVDCDALTRRELPSGRWSVASIIRWQLEASNRFT